MWEKAARIYAKNKCVDINIKVKGSVFMKKVSKFIAVLTMIVMSVVSFAGCQSGEGKVVLNVYNWGDYIDESVLDQFEEETGVRVNYETYATNEDMYVKIKTGGTSYDIAIPSDYMIEKMITEDMLEKIDFENVPNYKNIDGPFKNLEFDPENEYSVPYMWGTLGILYNKTMVTDPVEGWDILWNENYKGEILMLDSQRDSIGITLKKLGYSLNSTNTDELEVAKAELIKQKPLVLAYVGDEVKGMMTGEEAAIAVVWSGDAVTMMEENPNLEYVVPKEGTNIWFDNIVIPKGSEHKKEAEMFIDFLSRPDIALKNTEYIGYSSPNAETIEMLDEETRNSDVSYPDTEKLQSSEVFLDLGDFVNEYDRVWTEVKVQ